MVLSRPVTIGVAARRVGVPEWQLRAWERSGLLRPERSPSGYRLYSAADIDLACRIAGELDGAERLALVGLEHAGLQALAAEPASEPEPARVTVAANPGGGGLGDLRGERELRILRRLAHTVRHTDAQRSVIDMALESALEATGAYVGALSSADLTRQQYVLLSSVGLSETYVRGIDSWRLHEGLAGQAFGLREPLLVTDLQVDRHVARDIVRAEGLRAYVCVPLLRGQRRLGILEVFARTPGRFDLDDVALLELVAAFVAPLLELSDLERQFQSLQDERASSFREWSAQLAAAADAERGELGAALVATATGWAAGTTTVQSAADDVLRLSDRLHTRTGFQFDLIPLVRTNLVGRLARLHEIDVDLRLDEWPSTLPSGLTSRLYLVVLALAEEAAAVARSAVRLVFTSGEDALLVEIHDDREAPPGGIQVLPVPPDVLNAVRHLGGTVDFVEPAESASAGVRVAIPRRRLDALGDTLTLRERAVLECLRRGRSNRELASELGISPKTLQNHLTALYRKLGVTSRAEAIRYAERAGTPSGQTADSFWEGSHD